MNNFNYKFLGEVDLILDGNYFMHRNSYTNESLRTSTGLPTTSIYKTLLQIISLYSLFQVRSITVALDNSREGRATIRHLMYPLYKSTRKPMDRELEIQFDYLKEILSALKIPFILPNDLYEGDDVIGSLAYHYANQQRPNIVISGDGDMLQLVSNYTAVYKLSIKKGNETLYTLKNSDESIRMKSFMDEYGILPTQLADVKALMGDTSDCIPGVSGVGEKTALPLIQEFKNLDKLYEAVESVDPTNLKETPFKPKVYENLLNEKRNAYLSKELAVIFREIPINIVESKGSFGSPEAAQIYQKYEFMDIYNRVFNNNR